MVSDLHDPKVAIATAAVVSETNVDEEAVGKTRWVLGWSLLIYKDWKLSHLAATQSLISDLSTLHQPV